MATVKGIWKFKGILISSLSNHQDVNFSSNQTRYAGLNCSEATAFVEGTFTLNYVFANEVDLTEHDVYSFDERPEDRVEIGWYDEAYKTIDFGATEQTVSDGFYAWLVENTEPRNIEIDVSENGTVTLATAGTYCDRNIDVNVEVEDRSAEVFAGMAQGTIAGDYTNEEITSLRPYAFALCKDLTSVSLPNCTIFRHESSDTGSYFRNSEKLKTVNVPNLTTIENGGRAFGNCSALEKFNAPNLTCLKTTSTMFTTCGQLKKVSFPKLGGTTIDANTFPNCYRLETLILGGNELNPLANVNAFNNAGLSVTGGFKVYVPDNLVDAYKTATNWATYADQIKPISELEE